MACNCGKNRRLPIATKPNVAKQETGHVWFYAIPPESSADEPSRFPTLREARWFAQRQSGPGWMIEGRRETDMPGA